MKQRKRIYYTAAQRTLIWDRYQRGDNAHDIARLFDRYHSSILGIIHKTGGFRPPDRERAPNTLTLAEREEISRGLVAGKSFREIAKDLCKSPSTVCREVNRHGGIKQYRANKADKAAWENAKRPKPCKLYGNKALCLLIAKKMEAAWSPQQIAGWLKRKYPNNEDLNVSHETIYKTLYIQTRGALKKELQKHLRTQRVVRRSRHATLKGKGKGGIVDAVSISERPAEVEDRAVPGHWEGDLIQGSGNSFIVTLVERQTRYVMLAKVPSNKTKPVIKALIKQAKKLPTELYKSLTWDRGCELSDHKKFTLDTKIQVYFCDPQSPWQRGSNENTNRLLRQYFPKGTDLNEHSQLRLNQVARQLNERPRMTLEYETPAERFNQCVASNG